MAQQYIGDIGMMANLDLFFNLFLFCLITYFMIGWVLFFFIRYFNFEIHGKVWSGSPFFVFECVIAWPRVVNAFMKGMQ